MRIALDTLVGTTSRRFRLPLALLLWIALLTAGLTGPAARAYAQDPATVDAAAKETADDEARRILDDEDEYTATDEEVVWDPIEGFNRKIFWFNDKLDVYILEPVAQSYFDYVPQPIRIGVKNFFRNLKTPVFLVSDLVQLKFEQFGVHLGRFVVNTTAGLLGTIDVAREVGWEYHYEDFGVALGYHGVPEGPYLMLPLLGPSNARDLFGLVVDSFLDPLGYLDYLFDDGVWVTVGLKAVDTVDKRSRLLDAIKTGKEGSMDYYIFVQSTYHQSREADIHDGQSQRDPEEARMGTP